MIALRGTTLALAALALLLASPTLAGSAWPRGKGHFFGSVSYSTFGDFMGYAEALYSQSGYTIPGYVPPELTEETGIFAEYGLTEQLTFGLDMTRRTEQDTGKTVLFLRRNFRREDWWSSYGLEFGLGTRRDWRGIDDTVFRLGLSWGRGFETRWMDGWVDIDAKVTALSETGSVLWTVDSTVGVKPGDKTLIYLQMQSGALDGFPTYTRAVPTYVHRLGHGLSLESAALVGLQNDDSSGFKVGIWAEF